MTNKNKVTILESENQELKTKLALALTYLDDETAKRIIFDKKYDKDMLCIKKM